MLAAMSAETAATAWTSLGHSGATLVYAMLPAVCVTLGLVYGMVWLRNQHFKAYLIFSLLCLIVAGMGLAELAMMHARSPEAYGAIQRIHQVLICGGYLCTIGFFDEFMTGTWSWPVMTLCAARVITLLPNFIGATSLNYRVITRLQPIRLLGETVFIPVGQVNPWIALGQATVLGALIYIIHASVRAWRAGLRQKAFMAGGSIGAFAALGLTQAILHTWGIVPMPITVAWFFMLPVVAMGYQLSQGILEAEAMVGELQAQKVLTDAVFDGMPGLLGLFGMDGRLLRCNRNLERLTGYSAEELAKTKIQDWYRNMGLDRSDNRWSQGLEAERSVFETQLQTRKGDPLTVLISFARLKLKGIVHLLAIGIDITEKRRMELELGLQRRQLAHLDRVSAMGLLSASIAHELNQPLTAILSNAQAGIRFLAAPDPDLVEVGEILKDIAEEDARAGKVIRGMRALLKKEAAAGDVVDLVSVLEDTALMLRGESVIRSIAFRLDLGQDLPGVRGDRVQIQQVVLNLLVNAMEAMDSVKARERWIDLKAGRTGTGDLRIQVIDQGTGIPRDQLEAIFQPFRTSKRGGMGIGLSVCRSILESVGGRIWAENNEGPGATFTVQFPKSSLELP